jgi:hypothetical protein
MCFVTSFTTKIGYNPSRSAIGRLLACNAEPLACSVNWGIRASIMTVGRKILLAFAIVAALPGAAFAQNNSKTAAPPLPPQTSTEIPEPGDFALFLIGVAGLVVGRWTSKARKRRQE